MDNAHRDSDLGASSALLCSGAKLIGLEPRTSASFFFVFEDKPRCEFLVQQFWSGELQVNARGMCDALRTLKDLVFSRKREKNGTDNGTPWTPLSHDR